MEFDVVMPGYLFCDLIFRGLPEIPSMGEEVFGTSLDIKVGGAFNSLSLMSSFGLSVGLIADLGNDIFSEFIRSEFAPRGISTLLLRNHQKPMPAITAVLSFPSDRAFVTYMGEQDTSEPFTAEVLSQLSVKHLHLPGLKEAFVSKDLIREAIKQNIKISLDCQWHPSLMDSPQIWDLLDKIDVFLPNDKEALYLAKTNDIENALDIISRKTKSTVIKLGKDGAIGRDQIGTYNVPSLDVDVIDTTGAGDSFNAGFIYAYLKNYPFVKSIAYGNVCGGLSVTVPGGGGVFPSPEQFEELLSGLLK